MKKLFVSIALVMFVGSITAPVFASNSKVTTEFKKDEKKRKKKSKKGSCCAGKEATGKSCSSEKTATEKKSCHGHSETK